MPADSEMVERAARAIANNAPFGDLTATAIWQAGLDAALAPAAEETGGMG